MEVTNTLANYSTELFTAVKSFIVQASVRIRECWRMSLNIIRISSKTILKMKINKWLFHPINILVGTINLWLIY
jgi:hypothetical protein